MGAFTKLFSRLRITSDPNVATQTSAVVQADSGNTNLVIAPSGTGALVADIPDGTTTGGNARGNNAVDLQMARANANEVAISDYSTIAGGANNRAYGVGVFIGGGVNNSAGGLDNYQVIAGGTNNSIIASGGAFIGGGLSNSITGGGTGYQVVVGGRNNVGGSTYTVISGGQLNTANSGSHATVVGGQGNTTSGQYSVSGGYLNNVSGIASAVFGQQSNVSGNYAFAAGFQNAASADHATAFGVLCRANKYASFAIGEFADSYLYEGFSQGGGVYSGSGRAQKQQTIVLASREASLTSDATMTLSLDGTGSTNLIVPDGTERSWNVTIKYVVRIAAITGTATGVTVGDTKSQNIEIAFKSVSNITSLVGTGSYSIPQEDSSLNSAILTPSAGGSRQLALTFKAPTFAGGGSVTCRVVAKVELVETV